MIVRLGMAQTVRGQVESVIRRFEASVPADKIVENNKVTQFEVREARKAFFKNNPDIPNEQKKYWTRVAQEALKPGGLFVKLDKADGKYDNTIDLNPLLDSIAGRAKIEPPADYKLKFISYVRDDLLGDSIIVQFAEDRYVRISSNGMVFECDREGVSG